MRLDALRVGVHVVTPEMVAPGAPLGLPHLPSLAVLAEGLLHLLELLRLLVRVDHIQVVPLHRRDGLRGFLLRLRLHLASGCLLEKV